MIVWFQAGRFYLADYKMTMCFLNYKVYCVLLFVLLSRMLSAQQYFVRTDLVGLSQHILIEDDIKPAFGPKYSLGLERMFDSSSFSIGMQLNYGTLPYWESSYDLFTGEMIDAKTSTGFFCQPELRYYWRKDKPKYLRGIFLGAYLMYFNGENNYYSTILHQSGSAKLAMKESKKFQMLSLGVCVGYKIVVFKKCFIEPMLGLGQGRLFPKISTDNSTQFTSGNSFRLELGAGYCF